MGCVALVWAEAACQVPEVATLSPCYQGTADHFHFSFPKLFGIAQARLFLEIIPSMKLGFCNMAGKEGTGWNIH